MEQKHFYQKFSTWLSLSFLTGATAMVVGIGLFNPQSAPYSTSSQADLQLPDGASGVQVLISQPAEGEQINSNGVVGVSVLAGSAGGVKSIAVWIDGELAQTCAGARCSVTVSASGLPGNQSHEIQAIATAASGQTGTALRHFSVVK